MKTINVKSFLLNKEVWCQTLLWALFFASIGVHWNESWIKESFLPESVAPHIAFSIPLIFLVNVYWLIPTYFNKKKWHHYIWISLSLLVGFEIVRTFIFAIVLQGSDPFLSVFSSELFGENSLIFGLLNVLTFHIIFYSFVYRITRDWIINQSIIEKLKFEKEQLQLSNLQLIGVSNIKGNDLLEPQIIPSVTEEANCRSIKKTLSVKKRDGFLLLKVKDIVYFQAQGDFVFAFDNSNNRHIISESLKSIRKQICEESFFQINRSEIVHFNYIIGFKSYTKNRLEISLSNSTSVLHTSNSRTPEFRLWIENH